MERFILEAQQSRLLLAATRTVFGEHFHRKFGRALDKTAAALPNQAAITAACRRCDPTHQPQRLALSTPASFGRGQRPQKCHPAMQCSQDFARDLVAATRYDRIIKGIEAPDIPADVPFLS